MKELGATLTTAIILLAYSNVDALTRPSSIRLVNNKYTGIVVAIHNRVPENEELIAKIKYMFEEGSKYLYEATKRRTFFGKVTILVPRTWTPKPEYQLPGNMTFDYADVIVAPPNPRWAPLQYTKQYQGCGKQGVHIHFMDKFLLDPATEHYYGPLGRTLVHEWGHFRWGLFDEYPDPVGDPDYYQEFYFSPVTNQFEGVRCSYDHSGQPLIFFPEINYFRLCVGGLDIGYEKGCVYYISPTQNDVTSSIMYSTYPLTQIRYFCDDVEADYSNLHNREAPNKHNRLCGRRSAWEVLRDHEDFRNENNPTVELSEADLIPEITIVQHRDFRVVLALDTSGSMGNDNKFTKMISSSANYIFTIPEGSYIGIVEFNWNGNMLKNLTLITSGSDRQTLLASLPPDYGGSTAIGQGLLKAIQVLSEGGRDPAGGIILLIADGEENAAPFIADVMDDVIRSGVIVDTLAFTQAADSKLPLLSSATGGKVFFHSNKNGSSNLYEAFAATMERGDVRETNKHIQLLGTSWLLERSETRTGSVFMDSTLGNNTKFVFSWTAGGVQAIKVTITRPNGVIVNSTHDGCGFNTSFRVLIVDIQGQAEQGSWGFSVSNTIDESQEVSITISSNPASEDVEPIIVTSELSDSTTAFALGEPLIAYAEVRQGFSPVIDANVWATIERPGTDRVKLQLLDNGAGVDVTKNDGVYTRAFTQITQVGYYGIQIDVDNNEGKAIIVDSVPFSRARPIVDPSAVFDMPDIGGVKIPVPGGTPIVPTGRPAPAFNRGILGGSSRVDDLPPGFSPGDDVFPPGDVLDLQVKEYSFENKTVTLRWTAPGDDLDNGAASRYEIIRADSIQAWQNDSTPESHLILNSSHILEGDPSAPQEFGNLEEFVVLVAVPVGASVVSYAFVLRAFDDSGNPSGFSNAVQAVLREHFPEPATTPRVTSVPSTTPRVTPVPSPTPRVTPGPPPTPWMTPRPRTTPRVTPGPSPTPRVAPVPQGLESWKIAWIVVGCVVALFLVVAVVLAILKFRKSKEKRRQQLVDTEIEKIGMVEHTKPTYA